MVFDKGIGKNVKSMLGYNKESKETQKDLIDEEFEEVYDNDVISALETGEYGRAEDLLDSDETGFEEAVEDYIHHKITGASVTLEYFSEMVSGTEQLVEVCETEIAKLNERVREPEDKLGIKSSVNLTSRYVENLNSQETTESMRNAFKAFYQVEDAVDYIEERQDIQFSRYDADNVKQLSAEKIEEFRELDRETGLDFMVSEFNQIADNYNRL